MISHTFIPVSPSDGIVILTRGSCHDFGCRFYLSFDHIKHLSLTHGATIETASTYRSRTLATIAYQSEIARANASVRYHPASSLTYRQLSKLINGDARHSIFIQEPVHTDRSTGRAEARRAFIHPS